MEKVLDHIVTPVDETHHWFGKRGHVQAINEDGTREVKFQWFGNKVPEIETLVMRPEELRDIQTHAQKMSAMFAEFERYGTE